MSDGWRKVVGVTALALLAIPLIGFLSLIYRVFRLNPLPGASLLWASLAGITYGVGQYGAYRYHNAAEQRAAARLSTEALARYQATQQYRTAAGQAGTTRATTGQAGHGEHPASRRDEEDDELA